MHICFTLPPPQPPSRAYKEPIFAQVKPESGEKVVPKKSYKLFLGCLNSREIYFHDNYFAPLPP